MDRENLYVVGGLLFVDDIFKRVVENHFAEFDFDLHFSNAGNAQKDLVGRIFELFCRSRGQLFCIAESPDECVSIGKQIHSSSPNQNESDSSSSKSSLVQTCPSRSPKTRSLRSVF